MNVQLKYQVTDDFNADSVAVIGSFNKYNKDMGKMHRRGNEWYTEFNLPPGEYYYKFLIDSTIRLNDPLANTVLPHGEDELWTPLIIDEDGQRLYNNETYSLHIDSYVCGSGLYLETMSKRFCLGSDKQMLVRFGFTDVTGLHAVTTLWYNPFGHLHAIIESALVEDENNPDKPTYLRFKNALDEPGRDYPIGCWVMKMLIDGRYILEDEFMILDELPHISEAV